MSAVDGHRRKSKERQIMRYILAAAAVVALIATVPASAENAMGGGMKQNGQCWKSAKTMDGGTFGTWGACSAGASAPAPAPAHASVAHRHNHS
jgi:hypothetical protein